MKQIIILIFSLLIFSQATAQNNAGTNYITQLFQPGRTSNATTIISKINGNTEYKVSPGDVFTINIRVNKAYDGGSSDDSFSLALSNTYELEIPYIGTQKLKGLTFFQARDLIIKKMKAALPTLEFVNFALKTPAVFEVFVYGNVPSPGIVDVTALNHVHEALALCGGLLPGGSYRKLQITTGNTTRELDFLLYHTKADLSQDPFLEPGMKIYIPPAELIVQISGKVAYPGYYELKAGETLADLVAMSGGLLPDSSRESVRISRLDEATALTAMTPEPGDWDKVVLAQGDSVTIASSLANRPGILIEGALYAKSDSGTTPREIPLTPVLFLAPYLPGMTLLELLELYGGPTPFAQAEKSVLQRKNGEELLLDLRLLWESKDRALDMQLEAGDHLFIPMQNLTVIVSGMVNRPGSFPFRTRATVGDYILLAGGINPDKGSERAIYRISPEGARTRLSLIDTLQPGAVLYIGKNAWGNTEYTIGQVTTIVTITAALVGLIRSLIDLAVTLQDTFAL